MEEWIRQRREEALSDPVRREILELLADHAMSCRELRERLSGDRSLTKVNRHLAELQSVDLVWSEAGRYWRVLR